MTELLDWFLLIPPFCHHEIIHFVKRSQFLSNCPHLLWLNCLLNPGWCKMALYHKMWFSLRGFWINTSGTGQLDFFSSEAKSWIALFLSLTNRNKCVKLWTQHSLILTQWGKGCQQQHFNLVILLTCVSVWVRGCAWMCEHVFVRERQRSELVKHVVYILLLSISRAAAFSYRTFKSLSMDICLLCACDCKT